MISVCYVLSYYSPDYVRTRTIVKALMGTPNVKLFQARNSHKGFFRYFQTLAKLLFIRLFYNPKIYILGFRGYEFYWVVRLMTLGKVLIFDHMMSPYDSLVNEQKKIKNHLIVKCILLFEKSILHNCDLVLTDTEVHKKYFQSTFNVPGSKILTIPVGADEELFYPDSSLPSIEKKTFFEVLFYGSFLPLHGVDIILKAVVLLRDYPIHFTFIGGNTKRRVNFQQMINEYGLKNVTHIDWVEFEDLPQMISQSDIGLGGPFGNTGQGRRVITTKTLQFLAMAKPVIIGKIEDDGGFEDKINSLVVPQGDEKVIADAILWAFQHQSELFQIGCRGRDLYQAKYSVKQISEKLNNIFLGEFLPL